MKKFTKSYKKKCLECGEKFTSVRIDAKTCSDVCRARYSQKTLRNGAKAKKEGGIIRSVMSEPATIVSLVKNTQKLKSIIQLAIPEEDWKETIRTQVNDLIQAKTKHGKDSYQYQNILQAMTEWSVPRIKADGSIYLGSTKIN